MFGRKGYRNDRLLSLVQNEDYDELARSFTADVEVARELVQLIEDPDSSVRENAAHAIGQVVGNDGRVPSSIKAIIPQLAELVRSNNPRIRQDTLWVLYDIAFHNYDWTDLLEYSYPLLKAALSSLMDDNLEVQAVAASVVQAFADAIEEKDGDFSLLVEALPDLLHLLDKPKPATAAIATIRAIAYGRPEIIRAHIAEVITRFPSENDVANVSMAITLARLAELYPDDLIQAAPLLHALIENHWERVQEQAAIALGFLGCEHSSSELIALLSSLAEDQRERIAEPAKKALARCES
jgi:HEAT repeat protein